MVRPFQHADRRHTYTEGTEYHGERIRHLYRFCNSCDSPRRIYALTFGGKLVNQFISDPNEIRRQPL